MIALVDYGAGNLTSVRKGFAAAGASLFVPDAPGDLSRAAAIVVPGVGNFGATRALEGAWTGTIRAAVAQGTPLFGICLGMQWLFEGSDEAPGVAGLGAFRGTCTRLPPDPGGASKVPHVGWNSLNSGFGTRDSGLGARDSGFQSRLLEGIPDGAHVYFTHSYAAPVTAETIATCAHTSVFAAAVESGRVCGVQFHPEKSGDAGLRILRNFVRLAGLDLRAAAADGR